MEATVAEDQGIATKDVTALVAAGRALIETHWPATLAKDFPQGRGQRTVRYKVVRGRRGGRTENCAAQGHQRQPWQSGPPPSSPIISLSRPWKSLNPLSGSADGGELVPASQPLCLFIGQFLGSGRWSHTACCARGTRSDGAAAPTPPAALSIDRIPYANPCIFSLSLPASIMASATPSASVRRKSTSR